MARASIAVHGTSASLQCANPDPGYTWCQPTIAHLAWDYRPVVQRVLRWATTWPAAGRTSARPSSKPSSSRAARSARRRQGNDFMPSRTPFWEERKEIDRVHKAGKSSRRENGYDGQPLRGHDEKAAVAWIEVCLTSLELTRDDSLRRRRPHWPTQFCRACPRVVVFIAGGGALPNRRGVTFRHKYPGDG